MKLIILGAGGYGRTVADVVKQMGQFDEICFLDDNSETAVGKCEDFLRYVGDDTFFYPAFGNNLLRVNWMQKLLAAGCNVPVIIHPRAYVSPNATVGIGTVILPGAIVNIDTVVGQGCIINFGAVLDHDCVLHEGIHVCINAVVKADNHLPAYTKIEAGQVVSNGEFPAAVNEN